MSAETALRIAPLERDTNPDLVEAIRDRLEILLINGDIPSGGKLNEYALAQQMKVSRSALREAVRLLERSGLVTLHPNRGVFVRRVSLKQALDLFDVRAGLMRSAGMLAASRATDEQIAALHDCRRRMEDAMRARDFDAYYELNLFFHAAIMDTSDNERLAALYRMLSNELHLFRRRTLGRPAQLEASLQEHGKIIKAIEARDAKRAGTACEQHIMVGRQRMLDTLPNPHE